MSAEQRTLQLCISDEAMDILNHFCDPKIDIRFELAPSLLATAWIARWAIVPVAPGLSFLEDLVLHPLTVTVEGASLEQVMNYSQQMGMSPDVIASAVVSARGAQIAWFRQTSPLSKGIPKPPPPRAGA